MLTPMRNLGTCDPVRQRLTLDARPSPHTQRAHVTAHVPPRYAVRAAARVFAKRARSTSRLNRHTVTRPNPVAAPLSMLDASANPRSVIARCARYDARSVCQSSSGVCARSRCRARVRVPIFRPFYMACFILEMARGLICAIEQARTVDGNPTTRRAVGSLMLSLATRQNLCLPPA